MKRTILIIIIAMFALYSTPNAIGGCTLPDCRPYQYQQSFTYNPFEPLHLPNGCELIGPFEVLVFKCADGRCIIMFADPKLPAGCEFYFGDPMQFLNDIMKALLEDSRLYIPCRPTNVGDCNNEFTFAISSCWKWDGPLPGPQGGEMPKLIPCDNEGCCKITWRVCKTSENPVKYLATKLTEESLTRCSPTSVNCNLILCP